MHPDDDDDYYGDDDDDDDDHNYASGYSYLFMGNYFDC